MQAILNFRGKQDFNFKNYFILTKLEGFFKYHVHKYGVQFAYH